MSCRTGCRNGVPAEYSIQGNAKMDGWTWKLLEVGGWGLWPVACRKTLAHPAAARVLRGTDGALNCTHR